jgi:formiminoglutamase
MKSIKNYSEEEIKKLVNSRIGETKIGERLFYFSTDFVEELKNENLRFVVIGIAEDIGVRANKGVGGTQHAFSSALKSFLNIQESDFLQGECIGVLGEVFIDDLMEISRGTNDVGELKNLVSKIDERVVEVTQTIILAGKIPVVIGGGHNNSYGNIKGASLALSKRINVINCDPHFDFRELEGRHSGNGFSYAFNENYLNKYSVFAAHENYNNQFALDQFKSNASQLYFSTFENIFVREEFTFLKALRQNIGFVKDDICGIELDMDAITNLAASAKTSSGISALEARQFIYHCAIQLKPAYLHITEAAPNQNDPNDKTGKLIAYLISDFMKALAK